MNQTQIDEIMRLARLWGVRNVRKYAVSVGRGPNETAEGTAKSEQAARAALLAYLNSLLPEPIVPQCCCCGTLDGLHKDGFYGYRCSSPECMVF